MFILHIFPSLSTGYTLLIQNNIAAAHAFYLGGLLCFQYRERERNGGGGRTKK